MYIYENHMGGLYAYDDIFEYDQLYCETCGDSDYLIGSASTREEAWNLLKGDTDIDGSGGYAYEYVKKFIEKNWEE